MNVCAVGHYFWEDVYQVLDRYAPDHNIHSIASGDRENPAELYKNVTFIPAANIGLDMYKYDFYLKNAWNGEGGVFFMHDDMKFMHPERDPFKEVENHIKDFDVLEFYDVKHKNQSIGAYRNMKSTYISESYLKAMLEYVCRCHECAYQYNDRVRQHVPALPPHTGFLYDPHNPGITDNEKAVPNMRDINVAVRHFFTTQWDAINRNIKWKKWKMGKVVADIVEYGVRGKLEEPKK